MRMVRGLMVVGLLSLAVLPLVAAASTSDGAPPASDPASQQRVPVAIAQPLAAIDRPLIGNGETAVIPESGMLVLVGSALLGLASIVRRTTTR
jgi:hypothetical protein